MNVRALLIADYATHQGQKSTIVGLFNQIRSRGFPSRHRQMSVVVITDFAQREAGPHVLTVRLIDAERNDIVEPKVHEIEVPDNLGVPESMPYTVSYVWGLQNIVFEQPGTYAVEVLVDDIWMAGTPLHLLQIQG